MDNGVTPQTKSAPEGDSSFAVSDPVLFENLNYLGRCAFVESQRASEAGFAIDPLIV